MTSEAGPHVRARLDASVQPVRVRLDIAYDGTDFSGWAVQPNRRTVQGELQQALSTVLRTPIELTVAGRTDAGVHATGQVAHFDVAAAVWASNEAKVVQHLAGVLPSDVRVRSARAVPAAFDARFSALWRAYEYLISDEPSGVAPLQRNAVLWWPRALDDAAMASAAQQLTGLHDFVAFCKRRASVPNATSIRTVLDFRVERVDDMIRCSIRADAFCHSMVRSLVGALLAVGEGRRDPQWPASLFGRTDRANDVLVVPPHGLCLVAVGYPADEDLAARAVVTRAVRTLSEG